MPRGISAQTLSTRIDEFLASRGYKPPSGDRASEPIGTPKSLDAPLPPDRPEDFVCEDDVRTAVRAGRTLLISEKTIITPAARDLGDSLKVFVQAGWPR
jgi:hypothetical protein